MRNILLPRHLNLLVVAGFISLIFLLFSPIVFKGQSFGSPDNLAPNASRTILNEVAEETGEFPLWQPWIFAGMPTAEAFTNIGAFYFPGHLFKPFLFAAGIGLYVQLIHLVFAGLGAYFLLKQLKMSAAAALLGGVAFMMTPYMVTMIVFGHGSQMMTAAYIPWVMWATVRLFDKQRLMDMGILAILMGFQLQRGHVQIAYYAWMLVGAYVLYKILFAILKKKDVLRPTAKSTGLFLGAAVLAMGMALLIYLPSIEYTPHSVRGAGPGGGANYDYATAWSFHPKEMLTFLVPSAYGFGGSTYWGHMPFTDYPNYMGIIILALAVIGFAYRRGKFTWFIVGTSLLALFISFGKHFSLVYDLFYHVFPYFNKFRVPAMILILLQFNVAVLAAFGLESLLNLQAKVIPRWVWIVLGLMGLFALVLVIGNPLLKSLVSSRFTGPRTQDLQAIQAINSLRWNMWYQDAWVSLLFSGGLIGFVWLWIRRSVNRTMFLGGIVAIGILDIGIVDKKIIQPSPRSGRSSQLVSTYAVKRYFQPDDVIQFLQMDENPPFRIYPLGQLFGETRFMAFGIESVGGYHPAKLNVYNEFLKRTRNAGTLPLMRMLNVRYLISPQAISDPELSLAFTGRLGSGNAFVYRIEDPIHRAWFVREVKVVSDPEELWASLMSSEFEPLGRALVEQPFQVEETHFGVGRIEEIQLNIHRITIKTSSDVTGFLVVSEVYYPLRWKASVDGKRVDTVKTNGVLRGILLSPGQHVVEFSYDRSSFRLGMKLSLVSFALALGIVVFGIITGTHLRKIVSR